MPANVFPEAVCRERPLNRLTVNCRSIALNPRASVEGHTRFQGEGIALGLGYRRIGDPRAANACPGGQRVGLSSPYAEYVLHTDASSQERVGDQ